LFERVFNLLYFRENELGEIIYIKIKEDIKR